MGHFEYKKILLIIILHLKIERWKFSCFCKLYVGSRERSILWRGRLKPTDNIVYFSKFEVIYQRLKFNFFSLKDTVKIDYQQMSISTLRISASWKLNHSGTMDRVEILNRKNRLEEKLKIMSIKYFPLSELILQRLKAYLAIESINVCINVFPNEFCLLEFWLKSQVEALK